MTIKPIVFTLGLAALCLVPQFGHAEDRCAASGLNGHPAYCNPVGEGLAPLVDVDACCRGSDCKLPDGQGQCSGGRSAFTCEFAELLEGKLTCLFEVPHFCEAAGAECLEAVGGPYQPLYMCCPNNDFDDCFEYNAGLGCDTILYCGWGACNDDGSYSCMEPEKVW